MNELQIFDNQEFGTIRTVKFDGEPWFVGKDVAQVLEYKDTVNALKSHVDEEDKRGWQITTPSGAQQMTVINEIGLYSLVLSSKLPKAKKFKRWITSEVIPSIRRNGAYMTPDTLDRMIASPEFGIKLLSALKDEREKRKALEEKAEANRPKVLFADSVAASKSSILVGEMAKLLKQNGVETGQNRLFETLREKGFLIKRQGTDYNMPTQKAMEMGLFEIKETVVNHADGHTSVNKTPKVTGKGQAYFVNMFLGGQPE